MRDAADSFISRQTANKQKKARPTRFRVGRALSFFEKSNKTIKFALLLWVASQAGTPEAPVTAFDRGFFIPESKC